VVPAGAERLRSSSSRLAAADPFVAKGRDGKTTFWLYLPAANLNPTKKYPVIESIYAAPEILVPKSFLWPRFGH
jgi:dipeptidyl aminopeptidase/acylaminoacyl peptidase